MNIQTDIWQIVTNMGFAPQVKDALLAYIAPRHSWLTMLAKEGYTGETLDFPVIHHKPFTRLAIVCSKLPEVRNWFREKGIPENIFYATVGDIVVKQRLYMDTEGKIGISKDDAIWFRHIFTHTIFKVADLQFQQFPMTYMEQDFDGNPFMTFDPEWKEQLLPPGTPVLNIHIQPSTDLSPENLDRSFQAGKAFFAQYFPDYAYVAIIAYSWLLYPKMKALLPESSRILAFANRFTIIGSADWIADSLHYIYGKRYRKTASYPQKTSLQRAALGHFDCLGFSCGVISSSSKD